MLENRKVLTALIGYILGIIMGLYCKISIVHFYIIILICLIFKRSKVNKRKFRLFSPRRYFRYIKVIFPKKVIIIIIFFSIISNTIVLIQNDRYESLYKNLDTKNCSFNGIVEEIFKDKIKVKITNREYKNTFLYVYTNENKIKYGDEVAFSGTYSFPERRSNYKGFDKFEYYKTLKIYGTVKAKKIIIKENNRGNIIKKYSNKVALRIKQKIQKTELEDQEKALIEGILLGDKENLEEETKENFLKSNISHILAVSGMHVGYIILIANFIFNKIVGKHYSKPITCIAIIFYMFITGFTPSVVRAGITGSIFVMSNFIYRKNDILESLSIALIIILFNNPFAINDIGLELSFGATIGIVMFSKNMRKCFSDFLERKNIRANRKQNKFVQKIIKLLNSEFEKKVTDACFVTLSATIMIIPIIILKFNYITITSIIISIISGFLVGPIVIISLIYICFSLKIIEGILMLIVKALIVISKIGGNLPLNQIYFITPNIFSIVIFYLLVFNFNFILGIKLKRKTSMFEERIINILNLIKYKIKKSRKKIIAILSIIVLIVAIIFYIPKNLKVYFVDVGQGDCTVIKTPKNKTILIDGGGSEFSDFNVGKNTLMPYLLDRKIYIIDYIFFSHLDLDHAQGLFYILENMKVKNIVIGKQFEKNKNYEEFIKLTKNLNLNVVQAGERIEIEKDLYFDILWPKTTNFINENVVNNNSMVCKLKYKKFSMLFTGDIEERAEKEIIKTYKNKEYLLKADCLKVAHHGSKTSSKKEILELIKPKVALIGVGKNNKFGHPSTVTLENLNNVNAKVYRTDTMGEITIKSNGENFYINQMNKIK